MTDQAATFARRKARVAGLICFALLALAAVVVTTGRAPRAEGPKSAGPAHSALRPGSAQAASGSPGRAHWMAAYARLPLRFEVNQGQADPKVRFLSRGEGYALLLTRDEAILSLGVSKAGSLASSGAALRHTSRTPAAALRMKIEGASPVAFIHGTDELPGKSNYFIGNDPAKWRTGVPNYARVRYQDVYPGIDLVYYGNQRQLEYDFVVSSGADPQAIDLRVEGADRASLNTDGDLVLEAQGGRFVYHQPTIYQATNGARTRIPGGYVLGKVEASGAREVGFRVGPYDHSRALVIDPSLSYSTYLGGSKDDFANAIAVDAKGDAYITGDTLSTNFPTLNAEQSACSSCSVNSVDAFVTKINASGSALVYSTYLGGLASDQGNAIAVDASGDAYVTGNTASTNFPITSGAFQQASGGLADAFVTKLSPSGSTLVYSSYLGGSGQDEAYGIALDSVQHAYVAGRTTSTDFPTKNAYQTSNGGSFDAYVVQVDIAGDALNYSTYLGGSAEDDAYAIALDSSNNAYVTGQTLSNNFPTANAYQSSYGGSADAFVAKVVFSNSTTTLAYSTYLGGTSGDQGFGIAVDAGNNVYVTGETSSTNFPTLNPLQGSYGGGSFDAFLAKLDSTGTTLVYSTYLGGNSADAARSVAVDKAGQAHVAGYTSSPNFPVANPVQPAYNGNQDGFVALVNPMGCGLSFSTYLGGKSSDLPAGVATDSAGDTFVAGSTMSNDFPTAKPLQVATGGGNDAFVAMFPPVTAASVCLSPSSLTFSPETAMTTSQPMNVTLTNAGNDTLDITSIAASGPYAETNTCGSSVAAGQNCTISVTFSPITAAPAQAGLVTLTDNSAGVTGATQTIALTGDGADFQLQISPTTTSVTDGQTATYTVTLAASTRFVDTVALSCNGVPAPGSCAISPTSIKAIGGSNATAKVTVTTVAKSIAPPGAFGNFKPPFAWLAILLSLGLLAGAAWARRTNARLAGLRLATVAGILLLVALWFGCGVSNPAPTYTVPGNYTIQVTGTDGPLSHTVNATLSVQ